MGSLWFTSGCNRVLAPAEASGYIVAGQRIGVAHDGGQSQRLAFTLAHLEVFPMTHHVEAVALLGKTNSDLQRSDS